MSKPRLLDLFCGAGGAAMGYHRAGFEVVGVDIKPQPRYPFEFYQAGGLAWLEAFVSMGEWPDGVAYDAVHASPPCQTFTTARVIHGREHPDLLTPTRHLLGYFGGPWVIENVPGAPMRADFLLCGSQFGEGRLKRHRLFEAGNWDTTHLAPPCAHADEIVSVFGHGGHVYHGVEDWRRVMGIDWMLRDELAQAIPPAYTEFIGSQLIEHLSRTNA